MEAQLEPLDEELSTRELLRRQRKQAYEASKIQRQNERKQQKQEQRELKKQQRSERDHALWNELKKGAEIAENDSPEPR